MTDITALIATMKAAAEKATPGRIGDRIDGSGSIKYQCFGNDGSLVLQTDHKNMRYGFIGPNSKADELFFRECSPENVLALVEALEKAQQAANLTEAERQSYLGLISRRDERIFELEEAASEPVVWTDEQALRDVDRSGCGYLFTVKPITPNADPRRVNGDKS